MMEGLPSYDLLAEVLEKVGHKYTNRGAPPTTHSSGPLEVKILLVYPQNLGGNFPVEISALPYIRKPTTTHWILRRVITKWNSQ